MEHTIHAHSATNHTSCTTVALPGTSYITHQLPHATQPMKVYGQLYGGYCDLVL
jgi:hypothetical protein